MQLCSSFPGIDFANGRELSGTPRRACAEYVVRILDSETLQELLAWIGQITSLVPLRLPSAYLRWGVPVSCGSHHIPSPFLSVAAYSGIVVSAFRFGFGAVSTIPLCL